MEVMHLLKQLLPLLPSGPSAITNDLWLTLAHIGVKFLNAGDQLIADATRLDRW